MVISEATHLLIQVERVEDAVDDRQEQLRDTLTTVLDSKPFQLWIIGLSLLPVFLSLITILSAFLHPPLESSQHLLMGHYDLYLAEIITFLFVVELVATVWVFSIKRYFVAGNRVAVVSSGSEWTGYHKFDAMVIMLVAVLLAILHHRRAAHIVPLLYILRLWRLLLFAPLPPHVISTLFRTESDQLRLLFDAEKASLQQLWQDEKLALERMWEGRREAWEEVKGRMEREREELVLELEEFKRRARKAAHKLRRKVYELDGLSSSDEEEELEEIRKEKEQVDGKAKEKKVE